MSSSFAIKAFRLKSKKPPLSGTADMQEGAQGTPSGTEPLRVLQVHRRGAAGALVGLKLVRDFLTFAEAPHAGALERRRMDEDVLAAVVGLDETIAFGFIVPLDGSR